VEVLVVVLVEVVEDVEDMVVVIKWMILYQTIHQKEVEDSMAPEVIIYFKIKKYYVY